MMAPIDDIVLMAVGSLEAAKLQLLNSLTTIRAKVYGNQISGADRDRTRFALSRAAIDAMEAKNTIQEAIRRWLKETPDETRTDNG